MKIVIAVTGASGAIYAERLLSRIEKIGGGVFDVALIFSETAKQVWEYELGNKNYLRLPFRQYEVSDYFAAPASGSSLFEAMVICPCTMGTLGRIAAGTSNDLICRSADVILKEQRKLILVPRETPYSLIHLENMQHLLRAGALMLPASPSFYSKPTNLVECIDTIIDKIFIHLGIHTGGFEWGKEMVKN